jgi:diguanylate cyclase (GGDEF)-like protein
VSAYLENGPAGPHVLAVSRRRRTDHSPALLTYTAVQVVAAAFVFAWVALSFPMAADISLTSTGGPEGILLGLVFWVAIGLLGGTRVERLHGHGVLTFHLPFIVAAMALGGPAAGAVVAMVSTIEAREFREAPWYGVLANHASLTLSAVAGGLVFEAVRIVLGMGLVGVDAEAANLIAIVLASFVLTIVVTGLVAGTVILRDHLTLPEAIRVFDTSYRISASSEVVLGWILTFTYVSIGWWATIICATLVLVVWRGHDALEVARHDAMTGLLTRAGFDVRLADAIEAGQSRGQYAALLAIDLDGFKSINDDYGHAAGDDVIRAVGARLREQIRLTDSAVRRGGDEFSILLVDLPDAETASTSAARILARIRAPIEVDSGLVSVGASIGVYFIAPTDRPPTTGRLHDLTDRLMYEAKRRGGGLALGPPDVFAHQADGPGIGVV